MYALIGIAAVFAGVFGEYLLESGNLYVLFQPAELLIVGGAAAGIVMVANPPAVMLRMLHGCVAAFRPPHPYPESVPALHAHALRDLLLYPARRHHGIRE